MHLFISIHIMSKAAAHDDMEHYSSLHRPVKTDRLDLLSAERYMPAAAAWLLLQFIPHLLGGDFLLD